MHSESQVPGPCNRKVESLNFAPGALAVTDGRNPGKDNDIIPVPNVPRMTDGIPYTSTPLCSDKYKMRPILSDIPSSIPTS